MKFLVGSFINNGLKNRGKIADRVSALKSIKYSARARKVQTRYKMSQVKLGNNQ